MTWLPRILCTAVLAGLSTAPNAWAGASGGDYMLSAATLNNGVDAMSTPTYRLNASVGETFAAGALTGAGYILRPGVVGIATAPAAGGAQPSATRSGLATGASGITADLTVTGCTAIGGAGFLPAPAGSAVQFPFGLIDFTATGCGIGDSVTVSIQFSEAMPSGARLYKCDGGACSPYPASLAGNTVTYTVTDGGGGDADGAADGTIVDPAGPGIANVSAIPTLSGWALPLLAGLMGLFGVGAMRRRVEHGLQERPRPR